MWDGTLMIGLLSGASEHAYKIFSSWEGGVTITDLWQNFVVRDSIDSLPQAPCVSVVCGVAVDLLVFCSLDSIGQINPCCPESYLVTCSEDSISGPQHEADLPCHPWFLVGAHSDCLGSCYIINALVDVIRHTLCALVGQYGSCRLLLL